MNYAELTAAIQSYTENYETSFVANIPRFVRQVEERIHRSLLLPELRKNVLGNMTANTRYLARPADFLGVFSLAVIDGTGAYSYLTDKDMNFMREAYPNPTTSGLPKFYAMYDGDLPTANGNFILAPTPDASYQVELQYYYDPPSIVTAGTSWLGENAESALLYGCLVEAYVFMKGDGDMMGVYKGRYEEALQNLGIIDVLSKRDAYRDGDKRVE